MADLVFLEPNRVDSVPFTTSKVIADMTGINHRRVKDAIRKHRSDIESFGVLGAYQPETPRGKEGGRPEEIVKLNEEQATFLMTLLKNTPIVVAFKKELVHQFYAIRKELRDRDVRRAALKPVRRELTDVIKEKDGQDPWAYKKYTDLAYKSSLGKNAAQLRKERNAPRTAKAVDYLTADEISAVTKRQGQISVLLEMGLGYQEIKGIVNSQTTQRLAAARDSA